MEMSKIERYSNWCWIDRLDGVDLKDGEMLFVRFPDGHHEGITCIVKPRKVSVQDMGSKYDAPESLAFFKIEYHGVTTLVPLVGLDARRV